jgi:hypothetical protein
MALAAAAILIPTAVLAADANADADNAKLRSVIAGPCKTEFTRFNRATGADDPANPVIILEGAVVKQAAQELVACERTHGAKPPAMLLKIAESAPK